jgi:muconolactone D-isomerase
VNQDISDQSSRISNLERDIDAKAKELDSYKLDMENLPSNFPDILKEEQAIVAAWKSEGFLEHLFLRDTKNGAILIFKEKEEAEVKTLMDNLPFMKIKKSPERI